MTSDYQMIVPVESAHIEELARTMRQADIDELWAASRQTPLEGLTKSAVVSRDTMAGIAPDGRVVCVFGCSAAGTLMTPRAVPWLLSSEVLPQHFRRFARGSAAVVDGWRKQHPFMHNIVDARNVLAIRWLKWLKFDIQDAIPWGPDHLPFHPFEMRTEENV